MRIRRCSLRPQSRWDGSACMSSRQMFQASGSSAPVRSDIARAAERKTRRNIASLPPCPRECIQKPREKLHSQIGTKPAPSINNSFRGDELNVTHSGSLPGCCQERILRILRVRVRKGVERALHAMLIKPWSERQCAKLMTASLR